MVLPKENAVEYDFPKKYHLILSEMKDNLLPKNALKDDICGIIEKDDIHPRKHGISSDRKIKDDKKKFT